MAASSTVSCDDDVATNNEGGAAAPISSSNSSSSSHHDIGLNLSMDATGGANSAVVDDAANTTHIGVISEVTNSLSKKQLPPLPNPKVLPAPTARPSTSNTTDANTQTSSTLSREAQLESRIYQLEQSILELSQFCHTLLHSQQQQQQQREHNQQGEVQNDGEQQEVPQGRGGGGTLLVVDNTEEYNPSTPVIVDNDILAPSTTQYAPLDSPDASPINSKRCTIVGESGGGGGGGGEESELNNEVNHNMQMNSLSVKLGVTPYNNNDFDQVQYLKITYS